MVGDPQLTPGPPGTPGEQLWHEAAAGVQASVDADLREEAYEVFVAEAARCRLVDRVGAARVTLRCGVTLEGVLAPDCADALDGHLALRRADAGVLHVAVSAVLQVTGSSPALRVEEGRLPRSLASWLRECWSAGAVIRLIDGSGRQVAGRLAYVGADHVEVADGAGRTVVPVQSRRGVAGRLTSVSPGRRRRTDATSRTRGSARTAGR